MLDGAVQKLTSFGVHSSNITVESVPGSFELPFGAKILHQQGLSEKKPYDVIIAIGTLIKGDTVHFEYISEVTSHGLMSLQAELHIPVIFGVLTCLTEDQALSRAGLLENGHNHGEDWGAAAVEMAIKWKRATGKLKLDI